jgi:hypothetical protein
MCQKETCLSKEAIRLKESILKRNSIQHMTVKMLNLPGRILIYQRSFKIRTKVHQRLQKKPLKIYLNNKPRVKSCPHNKLKKIKKPISSMVPQFSNLRKTLKSPRFFKEKN